jgi:hypothetical protein
MVVKECVTGRIMRLDGRKERVGAVVPPYAAKREPLRSAIMVADRGWRMGTYEPGTIIYILDPGSLGQDTDYPERYTAWACEVLPRGSK